jgi:hypothetical protein
MRVVAPFLAVLAAVFLSQRAMAHTALIYRIDSASAVIVRNHLVISANGAVDSGGWSKPDLLLQKPSASEAKNLKTKFVAKPPASREVVVQALLPIHVHKITPLPRYGTIAVEVTAATNSVMVQITR